MIERAEADKQFDFDQYMDTLVKACNKGEDLSDESVDGLFTVAREMLRQQNVSSLEKLREDIALVHDGSKENTNMNFGEALFAAETLRRRAVVAKAREVLDSELSKYGINPGLAGHTVCARYIVADDPYVEFRIVYSEDLESEAVLGLYGKSASNCIHAYKDMPGSYVVCVPQEYIAYREGFEGDDDVALVRAADAEEIDEPLNAVREALTEVDAFEGGAGR